MISYYDSDPTRDYTHDFSDRFKVEQGQEERLQELIDLESQKEQEVSELWYRLLGCCVPEEEGE